MTELACKQCNAPSQLGVAVGEASDTPGQRPYAMKVAYYYCSNDNCYNSKSNPIIVQEGK